VLVKILMDICDLLGVSYDYEYVMSHLVNECDVIGYLLERIYEFLGGK